MPADILLYALIAAGLVFWLRSVLGTRHGEERERPNPFTAAPLEDKAAPADDASGLALPAAAGALDDDPAPALPAYFTLGAQAENDVADIARRDRSFSMMQFAQGAADAFAFVVEAFADGDRDTLKDLLAPPVYTAFDAAITDRETRGESVSTEIHAVRKAELLQAVMRDKMIYLTVRFTADETCVVRDKDGLVLSGHPDHVTEMVDVWTFGRAVGAKDPRWLVYETSDGDIVEDHKTPVPDAS